MKCPEGHDCGVKSTKYKGVCTPLSCCQAGPKFRAISAIEEAANNPPRLGKEDRVPNSEIHDRETEEEDEQKFRRQLAKLKRRRDERLRQIGFTGHGLQGADAEEYVQKRIQALTPYAIAEQEHRLFHGNDQARDSASRVILESGGHGKKEGVQVGASPVLILTGIEVPWAKKTVEEAKRVAEKAELVRTDEPTQRGASTVPPPEDAEVEP